MKSRGFSESHSIPYGKVRILGFLEAPHSEVSDNLSFTSATSDATGKDKRSIERAHARGEALGDDLAAVTGTSLDKGVELDALEPAKRRLASVHSPAATSC
jgi:hypothetical protein